MTYTEADDDIVLTMNRGEWATLHVILGFAAGSAETAENRAWVRRFVNELNRTNPHFTPLEIKEPTP